jgi:hypothetical protein
MHAFQLRHYAATEFPASSIFPLGADETRNYHASKRHNWHYKIKVPCQQRITYRHLSHGYTHLRHVLDKAYQFSITPVGLDIARS